MACYYFELFSSKLYDAIMLSNTNPYADAAQYTRAVDCLEAAAKQHQLFVTLSMIPSAFDCSRGYIL